MVPSNLCFKEPSPAGKCSASAQQEGDQGENREGGNGETSNHEHPSFPKPSMPPTNPPTHARIPRVLRTIPSPLAHQALERGTQCSASTWGQSHPDPGLRPALNHCSSLLWLADPVMATTLLHFVWIIEYALPFFPPFLLPPRLWQPIYISQLFWVMLLYIASFI